MFTHNLGLESGEGKLVVYRDYIWLRLGSLEGPGTILNVTEDSPGEILIGDRLNLDYDLWGRHVGVPLARFSKRPVLLNMAMRREEVSDRVLMEKTAIRIKEQVEAMGADIFYRPSEVIESAAA